MFEEQSSGQKDTFHLIEDDEITAVVDDLTLYLCAVLHIIRARTIYLSFLYGLNIWIGYLFLIYIYIYFMFC